MGPNRAAALRTLRRRLAAFTVALLATFSFQLVLSMPAGATPFTGTFGPTIIDGLADLNGDNEVTGRDDSGAFFGSTAIIDGHLDCDAWTVENDGAQGSGVIDGDDNCTLIAYDGTPDGVTIEVTAGVFDWPDGPLPTVFNADEPDNPDVGDSDFAWSTIGGLVDSDGNEIINANDCTFGLVGVTEDDGLGDATDGYDVLANTAGGTDPCGFGPAEPAFEDNGKVDLNSDGDIDDDDTCTNGCFFGHNVTLGVVQEEGAEVNDPVNAFTGTFGPTIVGGGADLDGDGVVDGSDDSNAFFGDAHIIDGSLDCDAWTEDNDGSEGDGVIDGNDDCTLVGVDGTPDGVQIDVVDGEFQWTGELPHVFNAGDPDNADIGDSDFAWSAIGGRVDSSGNELITSEDCHFGLIGEEDDEGLGDATDGADVLGNDLAETNPCGFATGPDPADNGLVDLDSDGTISTDDSCDDCFFGLDLDTGFVVEQGAESLDLTPETATNDVGTQHTVTAHVEDENGDPVEGVEVMFSVTGAHTASGTDVTDAGGDASFGYTGTVEGDDTIAAFADEDGDDADDPGEPGDSAAKTWQQPVVEDECPGFEGDPRNDVVGTSAGETLIGTADDDIICGLGGNDTVRGWGGDDLLLGGGGDDLLKGGAGADTLRGGRGRDTLRGGGGRDTLRGGRGNDELFGGRGADHLDGGRGRRDFCRGGPGADTEVRCEL